MTSESQPRPRKTFDMLSYNARQITINKSLGVIPDLSQTIWLRCVMRVPTDWTAQPCLTMLTSQGTTWWCSTSPQSCYRAKHMQPGRASSWQSWLRPKSPSHKPGPNDRSQVTSYKVIKLQPMGQRLLFRGYSYRKEQMALGNDLLWAIWRSLNRLRTSTVHSFKKTLGFALTNRCNCDTS